MDNSRLLDLPPLSGVLIEALESTFPARDFTPDEMEMQKLAFHFGQRSVVNFLTHHHTLQNETILNKE